jgi:putative ABC transport system permease protein
MIPVKYNVRSLAVRKTTTVVTAFGIALVVYVLATALMLSAGIKKTLAISGAPDVAIVIRKGSDAELGSVIDSAEVNRILGANGVKRDETGKPIGAGEVLVVGAMEKVGANGLTNVQMRGVTPEARKLRPEMKIIAGRDAKPGSDEAIVGKQINGRFKDVELDHSFELRKNRPVKVVGVFEAAGSSYESEVWVDVDTLASAYARQGAVQSVRVKLESPAAFDGFKAAMEGEKSYGYQAMRETEYFEKISEGTSIFINVLGSLIAFFCALGAMIGAMITMYSAVANRQREIGTLRALGFSRGSILFSFLLESTILALIGGAVGVVASLAMSFVHLSMMNLASWSEMVFSFDPTPRIIVTALIFAGGMGIVGGFFPALRASRVSPVLAMRGG